MVPVAPPSNDFHLPLALSVPPWEDLHEMSRSELRLANLVTTDAVADVFLQDSATVPMAEARRNGAKLPVTEMVGEVETMVRQLRTELETRLPAS